MVKRGRGRPKKIAADNMVNDVDDEAQETVNSQGKAPFPNDQLPEFFNLYVPSICSETMRIPAEFIKNFGGKIPRIVTLRRPCGQSWQVNISKISENWHFEEGWPEFVQENSVEDGDFLTFCYAGNSVFSVKVYAINGCRKRVENTSETNDKPIENLQENKTSEPESAKQNKASRRNLSVKSPVARKSVCRNPSFSITVTKTYIHKGFLHVPVKFCKAYMRKSGSRSKIVTLWMNKKSWTVGLTTDSLDKTKFSNGWTRFVKDNSLQDGNLCTFQLIDRNDLAFKVTICG